MLRIDEMLRDLAQIREEALKLINPIKQKKSVLPQRFEELKEQARQSHERFREFHRELGTESQPNSIFNILFENKDEFFYQHNLVLSMTYYSYAASTFLKASAYLMSLSKLDTIDLGEIKTAEENCQKINKVVDTTFEEIRSEITVFHDAAKNEGDKSLASVKDLLETLADLRNGYKNMFNLVIEGIDIRYKAQKNLLEQMTLLQNQFNNNHISQAEKDKALRVAAQNGLDAMIPLMELLISNGADIAAQGQQYKKNALHFVCQAGNVACFTALIKNQPQAKILKALSAKDVNGITPSAYIRKLPEGNNKKQMLKLTERYVLAPNRVASNLRRLRSMSFEKQADFAVRREAVDDAQYHAPKKFSR